MVGPFLGLDRFRSSQPFTALVFCRAIGFRLDVLTFDHVAELIARLSATIEIVGEVRSGLPIGVKDLVKDRNIFLTGDQAGTSSLTELRAVTDIDMFDRTHKV